MIYNVNKDLSNQNQIKSNQLYYPTIENLVCMSQNEYM
jgi:hypothetical protein